VLFPRNPANFLEIKKSDLNLKLPTTVNNSQFDLSLDQDDNEESELPPIMDNALMQSELMTQNNDTMQQDPGNHYPKLYSLDRVDTMAVETEFCDQKHDTEMIEKINFNTLGEAEEKDTMKNVDSTAMLEVSLNKNLRINYRCMIWPQQVNPLHTTHTPTGHPP
jgi:hypothetical protein